MSAKEWLLYLTIAGALTTLAATIWGLVKEVSVKDPDGRKRLTREGQVAVALAVGSALVGITSLGLRELIQKQDAAAAEAATLAEQRDAARQREAERRWQELKLATLADQQRFLSDLQRKEARRQAGEILGSQRLFAAVEAQRDRGIATSNRLFQIAESQRVILQSQPLNSLHVQLTIGGFNEQEFGELVQGANFVSETGNRDDDYGQLADLRPAYDDAGMFARVLLPALEMIAGAPRDYERGQTLSENILLMDLEGESSWLLPIGATSQTGAKGFLLNSSWLTDAANPHADGDDSTAQEFGLCLLPSIELGAAHRTVTVTWIIPSVCLPTAMHRAGATIATARLSDSPRLVVFRGARPFSYVAANITRANRRVTSSCWQPSPPTKSRWFIELVAIPNGNPSIGVRRRLSLRSDTDMDFQATYYDRPEHYGVCSLFQ